MYRSCCAYLLLLFLLTSISAYAQEGNTEKNFVEPDKTLVARPGKVPPYYENKSAGTPMSADEIRALPVRRVVGRGFIGSVSGTIVNGDRNDRMISVKAMLYYHDTLIAETFTDFAGYYEFEKIEEGTYTLQTEYNGYESTKISNIRIIRNRTAQVNLNMYQEGMAPYATDKVITNQARRSLCVEHINSPRRTSAEDCKSNPRFRINSEALSYYFLQSQTYGTNGGCGGRITAQISGGIMKYATVRLHHREQVVAETTTDCCGNYYFLCIPNSGTYYLEITPWGTKTSSIAEVKLWKGDFTEVNITLELQ